MLLLPAAFLLVVVPASAKKSIVNETDWKDTAGQPISAHEHFVGRFFSAFYWYGTSYKGKYIVAGSGVTGWNPNDTTYAIADSPLGPYSLPKRLGNWGTWGSQISNFLYVAETDSLIALCDQWWAGPAGRNDLDQSRYLWLPVACNPPNGRRR